MTKVGVLAVADEQQSRHPGLDPGSTFFTAVSKKKKVDAGSSPA
jgi:hypothetical protein